MTTVGLAPVLEAEDQDYELVILDLMQDAPVTGPDPPGTRIAYELRSLPRARDLAHRCGRMCPWIGMNGGVQFIAAAVAISRRSRLPGTWNIGIALAGIRGYRYQESDWPDYGPPCIDEEYVRVERFNLAAMERTPGDVTDKLLGRLLRGLRADTDTAVKALLLDPAMDEAADRLDEN